MAKGRHSRARPATGQTSWRATQISWAIRVAPQIWPISVHQKSY